MTGFSLYTLAFPCQQSFSEVYHLPNSLHNQNLGLSCGFTSEVVFWLESRSGGLGGVTAVVLDFINTLLERVINMKPLSHCCIYSSGGGTIHF